MLSFELAIAFVFGCGSTWIALNDYVQKRLDLTLSNIDTKHLRLESKIDRLDSRLDSLEVMLAKSGMIERRNRNRDNSPNSDTSQQDLIQ